MASPQHSSRSGYFQFGKAPAKRDVRNLKSAAIPKAPPKVPGDYDFDVQHRGVPTPMFQNDTFGDCVITGRAQQTLRLELVQQKNVGLGLTLPDIAVTRFFAAKPWDAETGPGTARNTQNEYYVYVSDCTTLGRVHVTWGRKQQMTRAFLAKYCDEAYAIIDVVNTSKEKAAFDADKIASFLANL